jgi:hypothetical protein
MTQALYAHMNNKRKKKTITQHPSVLKICMLIVLKEKMKRRKKNQILKKIA